MENSSANAWASARLVKVAMTVRFQCLWQSIRLHRSSQSRLLEPSRRCSLQSWVTDSVFQASLYPLHRFICSHEPVERQSSNHDRRRQLPVFFPSPSQCSHWVVLEILQFGDCCDRNIPVEDSTIDVSRLMRPMFFACNSFMKIGPSLPTVINLEVTSNIGLLCFGRELDISLRCWYANASNLLAVVVVLPNNSLTASQPESSSLWKWCTFGVYVGFATRSRISSLSQRSMVIDEGIGFLYELLGQREIEQMTYLGRTISPCCRIEFSHLHDRHFSVRLVSLFSKASKATILWFALPESINTIFGLTFHYDFGHDTTMKP